MAAQQQAGLVSAEEVAVQYAPQGASVAQAAPAAAAGGQELYSADRGAEAAQRYAAAQEAVTVHVTRFTCPRCGKSTDEEGLLCLECSARDALDRANLAIDAANEMAWTSTTPRRWSRRRGPTSSPASSPTS